MEKIQFHRKAVFSEAASIKFKIYFDGSKQMIGVGVLVKSTFPNGSEILRLL
jgi:hypothetical protein